MSRILIIIVSLQFAEYKKNINKKQIIIRL